MSIRILIAEDEIRIAKDLARRLQRLWPQVLEIDFAHDGLEALEKIEKNVPDIVFLDIHMPKMSGLEVAMHTQGKCHIVFATAYDRHAIEAFEVGAIDYIVKPADDERLQISITRLQKRIGSMPEHETINSNNLVEASPNTYLKYIKASSGINMYLIPVEEVILFRKEGRYTQIITNSRSPLIKHNVKELEMMLDPDIFWRIRSAVIINIHGVEKVITRGRDNIQIFLKEIDEPINVSRIYAHKFTDTKLR